MRPIIIKVYGWLNACTEQSFTQLDKLLKTSYCQSELFLEKDFLTLSYEGEYFPYDEFLDLILANINSEQSGKFDYIDLEQWQLTRFLLENGKYSKKTASLDNAVKIHEIYRD